MFQGTSPEHDPIAVDEKVVIRGCEIDVAVLDRHAALGLKHRNPAGCAGNGRKQPSALSRNVQNDEKRQREGPRVGWYLVMASLRRTIRRSQ
jgi:hypothetical protein